MEAEEFARRETEWISLCYHLIQLDMTSDLALLAGVQSVSVGPCKECRLRATCRMSCEVQAANIGSNMSTIPQSYAQCAGYVLHAE
jgi:radical SAM protein with 4Fe4S-binding SPASM domain